MKPVICIKLGGSLLTDKTKPFVVHRRNLRNIVSQLKKAQNKVKNLHFIIGNGAGSFGHYYASKYHMQAGIKHEEDRLGYCLVQDSVARLNRLVVEECLRQGILAVSMQPSAFISANDGQIGDIFLDPLKNLLEKNMTPVIYGDIIIDKRRGSHIFSTEMLFSELTKHLKGEDFEVTKIVHCGITDGILGEAGQTVPLITNNNLESLQKYLGPAQGFDVTGGVTHKVKEALLLARYGVKTYIINGTSSNGLYELLSTKKVEGTMISWSNSGQFELPARMSVIYDDA